MYSQDNVQFVIDALEQGWTIRKSGKFYELHNQTEGESLTVPSLENATSLQAMFEDSVPKQPIQNIVCDVGDKHDATL